MNFKALKNSLMTLSLCALAPATIAAPAQRADIPGDPAWLLHVDVDGLRDTAVGKKILAELNQPEQQARFAVYKLLLTFDPRTGLHGVTLYGSSASPKDALALVYADFDAERLAKLPEMAEDHKTTTHGKHTIHSWIDARQREKSGGEPRTYAAIFKEKVVIFAQAEGRLAEALDVLDGARPSLKSGEKFPQLGVTSNSVFAQGFAGKFDLRDSGPQKAVFQHSKQAWLDLKETNQKVTGSLVLEADGAEAAENISTVMRGLVALMALQTDKPKSVKLARALTIKTEGERTLATLSLDFSDIIALAKPETNEK